MKLATWNVNGIRARQTHLQEFIEREQPDLLCLQELKASPDQLPVWLGDLDGDWCYWHGGKDFAAKMQFLEALDAYAAESQAAGLPLILCGDLNVARTDMDVHPKERKPRAIGQLPEERALVERLLGRGLVDVHRQLDPDNPNLFTWWAPWRDLKQRNIGWRLDYVLASQALAARATSCVVQREVGTSDHGPVVAIFNL